MVLEDLGWTIHRIWSPDWTSNREREVQKINEKVDSLLVGGSNPETTNDVPEYEPEAVASESKLNHEALTEYVEPSLQWNNRYSVDTHGQNTANRNSVRDTVKKNGPIKYETAIQTYLDVWAQSRAGDRVKRAFNSGVQKLKQQNKIYEHDGFLWPEPAELDFEVRVNTESATRSIDEIPQEELAKAVSILLEEGGKMTRDDVVLETTRLIGYQRRGKRIEERIQAAIGILETIGAVAHSSDNKLVLESDVQIDSELLKRIY